MRTWTRAAICGLLLLLACLVLPADAVTTRQYADWDPLAGTSNNYTTAARLPVQGFPRAAVTTDSRSGSVGVQSGASSWLSETTPVGQVYGSSRNLPYLSLRPKADNATSPSVTTYTFEHPTPPTGWMIAFADIDADQVRVTAKDASGADVPAADLGFQGGFNFCEFPGDTRPSSCSTSIGDVPMWNASTQTLVGNPTAADTVGPTGWFQPTVPLSSLTVTYTRRSGFPIYSTYLAALGRTISGTVTDVSTVGACPVTGVTVRLVDPYGASLATTTPESDGSYTFGQNATQPGYTVSIEPPATCAAVGGVARSVSTATADATADFSVRQVIPQPVSGTVRADGQPLAGVPVTLHAPGGTTKTTTTAADGSYLFDNNPVDDGYFVTIDVPDGYSGTNQRAPFDVDTTPIINQDFTLTANPDVSGRVTGGGSGLGGVTVTLTPATGPALTTVTAADGGYTFERVPAGTYDISVEPPPGFDTEPPINGVDVAADDVPGQDFALSRAGAIGGTVANGDEPVAGAEVTIDGPGGPQVVTTDRGGQFFLDGLSLGDYDIDLTLPAGFSADGPTEKTTTITDEGEIRGGIDFAVTPVAAEPTPTPSPSSSPSATPTPGTSTGSSNGGPASTSSTLPDTGSDVSGIFVLGALLLVGAGAVVLVGNRIARRRKH